MSTAEMGFEAMEKFIVENFDFASPLPADFDAKLKRAEFLLFWHSPGFREALEFYMALSPEAQERLLRTGDYEEKGDDEQRARRTTAGKALTIK